MNAIHVAENRTDIRGHGPLFGLSRASASYRTSQAGTVAISTPMKEKAAMENDMLAVLAGYHNRDEVNYQYAIPTAVPSSRSTNTPTYSTRAPEIGHSASISPIHCITNQASSPITANAMRTAAGQAKRRTVPLRTYSPTPRTPLIVII